MKLLSIHVGKVQTHQHNDKDWTTAYDKKPVSGSVYVNVLNVEGDQQHHTKFHGGVHRAVLMYSAENYDLWEAELGHRLPYGSFAENFTVSDMDENSVCIGDIYQIGDTVRLQVAQPRQPCNQIYKALGVRGIVNKINANYRSGWYLRVLQEGIVEADMVIKRTKCIYPEWTIAKAHEVMNNRHNMLEEASELASIEELEPGWCKKLAKATKVLSDA